MTETDARAQDVYAAALETPLGTPGRQRLRVAGAFVAELAWGLLPHPSVSDLVVRRLADDVEVVRVPAGDPNSSGDLLARTRADLAALTPAAFDDRWGLEPG